MKRGIAALVLLGAAGASLGQPIYRCGPGGREYSQTPCPGGRLVEATDPRSAAQRAEANRVAEGERRMAIEKGRERRAAEAAAKPPQASGFNGNPPPVTTAASTPQSKKYRRVSGKTHRPGRDFVAVPPNFKQTGSK